MKQQKQPLIFGDPNAPLTVGVFVRWLHEYFQPHSEQEVETRQLVESVNVAMLGNGDPHTGIVYKVDEMWEATKRMDIRLNMAKIMWATLLSLFGAIAGLFATGHTLGWW